MHTINLSDFYAELRADFSADPLRVLSHYFPGIQMRRTGDGWVGERASDEIVRNEMGFGGKPQRLYVSETIPGCMCFAGGVSQAFESVIGKGGLRGAEWVAWVRELAGMLGRDASVLDNKRTPDQAAKDEAKARAGMVLADAWALMMAAMRDARGKAGRDYMAARAVDITDDFPVGWCPSIAAIRDELVSMGHTREDVEAAGLNDSRWDSRVVLAWTDARGVVRALQARRIDKVDDAKYLYAGSLPGVYGLPDALRAMKKHNTRRVVVVEGVLDVLVARRVMGDALPIIATGGTFSRLSAKVLGELRRAGVDSLVLATDNDKAGRDALLAMLPKLADTPDAPDALVIPPESYGELKDPDAIMNTLGCGAFVAMVGAAIHWPRYVANVYLRDVSPDSPDTARIEAVGSVLRAMGGRCPTRHLDADALDKLLADRTGYTREAIRERAAMVEAMAAREKAATELATAARELRTADDVAAVVARARDAMGLVSVGAGPSDKLAASENDYDATINEIRNLKPGLPTGWAALDDEGVGFRPGELSLIAARPSHGKTAILVHLMCSWLHGGALSDRRIIFFSHEEKTRFLLMRMLAWTLYTESGGECDYGSKRLQSWVCGNAFMAKDEAFAKHAENVVREWFGHRVTFVYRPHWDAEAVKQEAARYSDAGVVVCDYLQKIPPPPEDARKGRRDSRRDMEVTATARALKAAAIAGDVPVILAAQIGRENSKRVAAQENAGSFHDFVNGVRQNALPRDDELREGGSEQEADLILAVMNYAKAYPNGEETKRLATTPFDVGAIKNRYGMCPVWAELRFARASNVILPPAKVSFPR